MNGTNDNRYNAWIEEKLGGGDGYGRCQELSKEMQKAFPELVLCRGHAHCPAPWGMRQHWWLKTEAGEIVDPTAAQFPRGVFQYEEWKSGDLVGVGKCKECGTVIEMRPESLDEISRAADFCSDRCCNAFVASLIG